jgi:hypothetical protein
MCNVPSLPNNFYMRLSHAQYGVVLHTEAVQKGVLKMQSQTFRCTTTVLTQASASNT